MFQFKQFTIHQNHCAQKVSEVACIQGAWTQVPQGARHVLDIGSGTGLLSLMVAQRFDGFIDAIELDEETFWQGKQNIEASPFAKRIRCLQGDIRSYAFETSYDFIITNPPFFERQLKANTEKANQAKHSSDLGLHVLIERIHHLLSLHGSFSILFPFDRKQELISVCEIHGFYPLNILALRHSQHHTPKVMIAICSRKKTACLESTFIIKEDAMYTKQMQALMNDYYL